MDARQKKVSMKQISHLLFISPLEILGIERSSKGKAVVAV